MIGSVQERQRAPDEPVAGDGTECSLPLLHPLHTCTLGGHGDSTRSTGQSGPVSPGRGAGGRGGGGEIYMLWSSVSHL